MNEGDVHDDTHAVGPSDALFRLVLSNISDAVFITDEHGVFTFICPNVDILFGYSEAEVAAMGTIDCLLGDMVVEYAELNARGVIPNNERMIIDKAGTPHFVLVTVKKVRIDHGTMLYAVHDISDCKAAEAAKSQAEEKYRQVFDNSLDAILITDEEAHFLDANRRAEELTGYTRDELLTMRVIDIAPELEREQAWHQYEEFRHDGQMAGEFCIQRKDGILVPVDYSATRIAPGRYQSTLRDIAERKRAEAQLREREMTMQTVFDLLPVGVWLIDRESRIVQGNPAGQRIWGGAEYVDVPQYGVYKGWWVDTGKLIAPEEWAAARAICQGETSINEEIEIEAFDGTHKIILNSAAPIRDQDGRIIGAFIVNQDITARKRAEQVLRESEEKYRQLFEHMSEALARDMLICDENENPTDWVILEVNPAYEQVMGIPGDQVIGKRASTLYGRDTERPLLLDAFRQVMETGQPARREVFFPKLDRHLLMSIFRLDVRTFATLSTDITERKHTEELVKRERAFCTSAIDILPFPMAFVAPDMAVVRCNQALLDFFGAREGQALWEGVMLTSETRALVPVEQWPVVRALHGEITMAVEAIIQTPVGLEVPVLMHAAPIYLNGELVAAVIAIQDITPLKEADRAKDEFLAIVSHELLNPLTNILGWAQAAQGDPELAAQALSIIMSNATRQKQLVDDLLDMSRVTHQKIILKPESIDLWQQAADTMADITPSANERRITLALEGPDCPLPVKADPIRIRQVINNLLTNALKFTDPGGRITVRGYREGGYAVIQVQDTGRGIPVEELHRLFRPFYQLERTRTTRGLGIGLALVRGIIELSGGRVSAASPGVGQGSTFTIALPLAE